MNRKNIVITPDMQNNLVQKLEKMEELEMRDMTVLSSEMFEQATNNELSIKDAVVLLKEQAVFRTLKDKLMRFEKGRDLKKVIVDGLLNNNPGLVKESVQRKVRGWFNNDERNIKKQDAMELCFILDLSLEEADLFLAMVSEEGIHWRNPEEIVFAFAISKKISYNEAKAIYAEVSSNIQPESDNTEIYTALVQKEVMEITSTDDLKAYISQSKAKLGTYHNTAFSLFTEYMNILENPTTNDELPEEKRMSAREISERYLNDKIIPRFKKNGGSKKENSYAGLSVVERNLRLNWPDEFTISRIKNREIDVSRKILILLFLATDGGELYLDDYEEYYELNEEDVFKETYLRLSAMLKQCGFAQLDPRVPFDWMILYCICVSDTWEIDDKMKKFLKEAFDSGNEIQK